MLLTKDKSRGLCGLFIGLRRRAGAAIPARADCTLATSRLVLLHPKFFSSAPPLLAWIRTTLNGSIREKSVSRNFLFDLIDGGNCILIPPIRNIVRFGEEKCSTSSSQRSWFAL